jgi:O-antigen/teichoic acid export membrane protein
VTQSWSLGKWLLMGRVTTLVQGYVVCWLSIVIAGAAATGVYAACMSIVSFANPLMFGLGNVLTPRLALAWKIGGGPELWREALRNTLLLGAVMAAFCLAVAVAGDALMDALYRGEAFEGQLQTLIVLALAVSAVAVGMPASNALATMERPRATVAVGITTSVMTIGLVWWLMTGWGLPGAAYGLLIGNVSGALGRWAAFSALVPHAFDDAPIVRVAAADDDHAVFNARPVLGTR